MSDDAEQLSDLFEYVELEGTTRAGWRQLSRRQKDEVLSLPFVKRWSGTQIFFQSACSTADVAVPLGRLLKRLVGSSDFLPSNTTPVVEQRRAERLQALIRDPSGFSTLSFGADVAERDAALLRYFVATKAFERADSGAASVIIGPKGSGKTAILTALQAKRGAKNTIVITPEIFATSMLKQVVEGNRELWNEDEAFTSTWVFTILVEVFKRLSAEPRGVPGQALKHLRVFLRDNANYQEVDIFTRFVGYLKRIEGVKVGPYEISIKTRMLQELYSLAPIYEIVPKLRGVGDEVLILIDELDQGWDNSEHANQFIGSLLKAAIRIQNLGLRAHVVAFLRSEIFDLVKNHLDQLDKLRSSIETLRWSDGELADLVARRVAHSLKFVDYKKGYELAIVNTLFDGRFQGMSGFEYLVSRTSTRPREVLQFLSHAHRLSMEAGQERIVADTLVKAEEDYSVWKFEHMCAEYTHIYPGLSELLWCFRGCGPVLAEAEALSVIGRFQDDASDGTPSWAGVRPGELLQLLFAVEFLGVPRPQPKKNRVGLVGQFEFSFERRAASIKGSSNFLIHPALWSVLEVPSGTAQ